MIIDTAAELACQLTVAVPQTCLKTLSYETLLANVNRADWTNFKQSLWFKICTESEQNVTLVKNDNFSRVTRQFSNKATDKH